MRLTGLFDHTEHDRPAMAAGLMLTALFSLGFQDALVRIAAAETSIWLFQFLRSSGNLVLILILARVIWGGLPRAPRRIWAVVGRSFCLVAAMICFFGGVQHLTLAEMAAGLYTFPIFVTLLSALLLGERVGPPRILAVAIGALGAVLILQPTASDFTPVKLLPVLAGVFYAGVVLFTRRWCREESPVTLATGVALALGGTGLLGTLILTLAPLPAGLQQDLPYLARGWVAPSAQLIALALTCSVLNLAANIALAKAYQSAEASWLAPFDYSYLIFATFWGWVIFADLPDGWMVLGMALVAGAGVVTAWREARRPQR